MRQVLSSGPSLVDLAALDQGTGRGVKQAVERFAETGTGDVERLQGINPPEYRLRAGDYRVRLRAGGETIREAYR